VDGKYGQAGENLGGDWKIWVFGGKWTDICIYGYVEKNMGSWWKKISK
jgi:hypothetical protein